MSTPPMEPRQPRQSPRQVTDDRKPIEPLPPRWQPNPDPDSIVVPGLDTSAPVNEQIDYMEQLITIKLQNVDSNMAKIQDLLTNRLLPTFKKFAESTEPVREAAKFWVNFFEKAARVRLPIYDDIATQSQSHTNAADEEQEGEIDQSTIREGEGPRSIASDSSLSFLAGESGAVSSTPAAHRLGSKRNRSHDSSSSSIASSRTPWENSLESPMERLDRGLRSLGEPDEKMDDGEGPSRADMTVSEADEEHRRKKGKYREVPGSGRLLENVLRSNMAKKDSGAASSSGSHAPLQPRSRAGKRSGGGGTPKKALNPFLPDDTQPEDWNGVVDLRTTPLNTPRTKRSNTSTATSTTPSGFESERREAETDEDEEDNWYPPGMSPPRTFTLPARPRSLAEIMGTRGASGSNPPASSSSARSRPSLGQTPKKTAAERIKRDLLLEGDVHSPGTSTTGSMPDLSRYMGAGSASKGGYGYQYGRGMDTSADESFGHDASIESLMRRVTAAMGDGPSASRPKSKGVSDAAPAQSRSRSRSYADEEEETFTAAPRARAQPEPRTPEHQMFENPVYYASGGAEEEGAYQGQAYDDASIRYDHPAEDSFSPEQHGGREDVRVFDDTFDGGGQIHRPRAPLVPQPQFDDSFDDDAAYGVPGAGDESITDIFEGESEEEETVFGGRLRGGRRR